MPVASFDKVLHNVHSTYTLLSCLLHKAILQSRHYYAHFSDVKTGTQQLDDLFNCQWTYNKFEPPDSKGREYGERGEGLEKNER